MLSILSLITCLSMFAACDKDPEIITKTEFVTIIDTVVVIDTFTVFETIIETVNDTATTFILVRHAETTGSGSNPSLSSAGQTRANALQKILDNIPLNAVFSTNFNRTMQTATPTATDQSLTIAIYDAFNPDALIDQTLTAFHDGVVLIVGHSNTTPDFLNVLTGSNSFTDIPETEYDNLFIVHVYKKGRAEVLHMKYGE